MRIVRIFGVLAMVLGACVPMRTLRGSTRTYLTQAGAQVVLNRPAGAVAAAVQEIFAERGFPMVNRFQVTPSNLVLFFRGGRFTPGYGPSSSDPMWAAAASQVGSWFAVRIIDDGVKSTLMLYGKPTVNGTELCGEGDDLLRDAKYSCIEVRVREDWPAVRLVEGREETEVVSAVISTLTERLPDR